MMKRGAVLVLCGCNALFGLHSAGESDRDGDRVPDAVDNCPDTYNPDQSDVDHNGVGDACSGCFAPNAPDSDGDGIPDPCDGCDNRLPDNNHDGVPDACEHLDAGVLGGPDAPISKPDAGVLHDEDGDTIPDDNDDCPSIANTQKDIDGDGVGDACDLIVANTPDTQIFDPFTSPNQLWFNSAGSWVVANDEVTGTTASSKPAVRMLGFGDTNFVVRARLMPGPILNGASVTGVFFADSPSLMQGSAFACEIDTPGIGTNRLELVTYVNGGPSSSTSIVITLPPPYDVELTYSTSNAVATIACGLHGTAMQVQPAMINPTTSRWFPGIATTGAALVFANYDVVTDRP